MRDLILQKCSARLSLIAQTEKLIFNGRACDMSEQALHSPSVVAFPNKEDELDKVGQAACDLVHQAASAAEQKAQHVLAVAHKISLQLRAAEDRVASLEAEVKHYRVRADRAEKWLHRIALEIQQTFLSTSKNGNSQTLDELESLKRYVPKRQKIS
jgi:hypothetical protein